MQGNVREVTVYPYSGPLTPLLRPVVHSTNQRLLFEARASGRTAEQLIFPVTGWRLVDHCADWKVQLRCLISFAGLPSDCVSPDFSFNPILNVIIMQSLFY